ncbi:hypothetical protein IWQ61_009055 [Dispira simplex]|nr:hypothetical protein IWQ61_009055 [Dispira simplex]
MATNSPARKLHSNQLQTAFHAYDTTNAGSIKTQDLKFVLKAVGLDYSPAQLRTLITELDPQRLGRIDYQPFFETMQAKLAEQDSAEEIAKIFTMFDASRSGKIGVKDLERVAVDLDEHIPLEELQQMIDMADRDGDGFVDLDDFTMILKRSKLF